jgi:hypothetical protein
VNSTDLLVPGMNKCTECHSDKTGETSADRVTLQCVGCHSYHPHDLFKNGETETGRTGENIGS